MAMKKFLKMLGVAGVVLLLLLVSFDLVISSGLRKSNMRMYSTWNDIYASNIKSDVVVIGSSETLFGYNTYIMDSMLHCNSYNLGINGHAILYQLLRYNTYRRYCPKPKVVIVNMVFFDSFGFFTSPFEREQFFPYILDDSLMDEIAKDKRLTFFDRYMPFYRYYGYKKVIEDGVCAFFDKKSVDEGMYKGFRSNDYEWSSGVLYNDEIYEAPLEKDLISMFCSFIQRNKKEGVKVVLVSFPEYHPLRDKYSHVEQVEGVIDSIAQAYQIPWLDYGQVDFCYDSTLYYEPNHLNSRGVELFTTRLCHDLDSLNVIE